MGGKDLQRIALLCAYPALRQLPRAEWDEALKQARETNFDMSEWIGVLAGIAFVTYLLRFDADQAAALSLPSGISSSSCRRAAFALVVGPFICAARRGLDQEIEHRHGPGPSDPSDPQR